MPTGITLETAIKVFQKELGCAGAGEETDREYFLDQIWSAMEFLLLNGGGDILREWQIVAKNNNFTFPRDLETPLKYRLSTLPGGNFGVFNTPWYSYSSNALKTFNGYRDWDISPQVNMNRVFTQYRPDCNGVRLLATTRNPKDVGKKIMVSGKLRGMVPAYMHNGVKTAGELLTIQLESDGENRKYSSWMIDEITGVVKDSTCDWVMLSGYDNNDEWQCLSHYHPDETHPMYVEGRVHTNPVSTGNSFILMHVLGRINPSIRYTRDEDILPITSFSILQYLAQRAKYEATATFNTVAALEQRIKAAIKIQIAYQQAPGKTVSVNLSGSSATLSNV